MNDSITLTKNDRKTIFQGVLLLAKAFVELAAFASNVNESIKEQGDDIIQYTSTITHMISILLELDSDEAMNLTKDCYNMSSKSGKMSSKTIDNFLSTKA